MVLFFRKLDIQFSSKVSGFSLPIRLNCKQPLLPGVAGISTVSKILDIGITSRFDPSIELSRPLRVFQVMVTCVSFAAMIPSAPCASMYA